MLVQDELRHLSAFSTASRPTQHHHLILINLLQDFLLPLCYWQLPGIFTSLGEVKTVDEVLLVLLGAVRVDAQCLDEGVGLNATHGVGHSSTTPQCRQPPPLLK